MGLAAALILATSIDVIVAAGTAEQRELFPPGPGEWHLDALYFVPATAVAKHATNYVTVTAKRGTGGSTVGSFKTENVAAGIALTKGTSVGFTIAETYSSFTGGSGSTDCLEIDVAHAGAGAACDGVFIALWRKYQGD